MTVVCSDDYCTVGHVYPCIYVPRPAMQPNIHAVKLMSQIMPSDQLESFDNQRDLSYPSLVDSRGQHISYNIHRLSEAEQPTADTRTYFKLEAFGKKYLLNVSSSTHFVHNTPNDVPIVEYIGADGTSRTKVMNHSRHCFHSGHVHLMGDLDGTELGREAPIDGWVAMSSCLGLVSNQI